MTDRGVVIVTGGTRGIGKGISLELAKEGYRVIALYARNRDGAKALVDEGEAAGFKIETIRGDLSKDSSFKEIVDEIKSKTDVVDVIVHAAASGVHKPATELSMRHLRWTFEINVFSIHNLVTQLVPMMSRGGKLIGVTSHGGTRVIPYYAAVGSTKGALESLFRHYASELAPKGIAVNLVCPGMVMTDAVEAFPEKDQRIESCISNTPTGKMTTVEEVSGLVGFLCTSAAGKQIIGQTFFIDGGKCLSN